MNLNRRGFIVGTATVISVAAIPKSVQAIEYHQNIDRSLLQSSGLYDSSTVGQVLAEVKNVLTSVCQYAMFEKNDHMTQVNVINITDQYMRFLTHTARAVEEYQIVCDTSNNTTKMIDNNELQVDVYFKPKKSTEYYQITATVNPVGIGC